MDDNEMIQKFLLHNITEENINIEYEQLLTIYKNINWNNLFYDNKIKKNDKEICMFSGVLEDGFGKQLGFDIDCKSVINRDVCAVINDKYIVVDDMIFQKLFQPKDGAEFGIFIFVTLYKLLIDGEVVKLTPLVSREIIYNRVDMQESKPIYYYEENYQNIDTMEYGDIIKKVLVKKK